MTLELTTEQRTDITGAVAHKLDFIERLLFDPRTTAAIAKTLAAEKQRLQSLFDLFNTPGTTVILHRP